MRTKEQIDGILSSLEREYPMADCSLTERDAWRLLVQVRLAAQCTDARVNLVTPALFARFPTAEAMAAADIGEVEELIRSCGFYHGKARDLVWQAQRIAEVYGGKVPDNMDDLLTLPGVGRKSANLIRRRIPPARRGRGGHALHPPFEPPGACGQREGSRAHRKAAARRPPAGEIERFLPPARAPRPRRVHRT